MGVDKTYLKSLVQLDFKSAQLIFTMLTDEGLGPTSIPDATPPVPSDVGKFLRKKSSKSRWSPQGASYASRRGPRRSPSRRSTRHGSRYDGRRRPSGRRSYRTPDRDTYETHKAITAS